MTREEAIRFDRGHEGSRCGVLMESISVFDSGTRLIVPSRVTHGSWGINTRYDEYMPFSSWNLVAVLCAVQVLYEMVDALGMREPAQNLDDFLNHDENISWRKIFSG